MIRVRLMLAGVTMLIFGCAPADAQRVVSGASQSALIAARDSDSAAASCAERFVEFTEFPIDLSSYPAGQIAGASDPVYIYRDAVDVDADGADERVYVSHKGDRSDHSGEPYSVVFVVRPDNPAFARPTIENIANLVSIDRIRDAEEYGFSYLSFDNAFQRFGLLGGKSKNEVWSPSQLGAYLESLGLFRMLNIERLPPFGAALVRVGRVDNEVLFLISVKPLIFDGSGNKLTGYNEAGQYVGPRYEFLAHYHGASDLQIVCARYNDNP